MDITTPESKATILEKLKAIGNCMTRAQDEKDLIKDIVEEVYDEFDIPKKTVKRLAKVLHEQNFETEAADFTEFELLYQALTGKQTKESGSIG